MGILDKVKKNIKENGKENDKAIDEEIREESDFITVEGKKFFKNPNIEKIRAGEFGYFPIECLLNQFILKDGLNCYYVALDDEKGGNSFEIYEFNYADEDNVEYRKHSSEISGEDYLCFLVDKVMTGYDIFCMNL